MGRRALHSRASTKAIAAGAGAVPRIVPLLVSVAVAAACAGHVAIAPMPEADPSTSVATPRALTTPAGSVGSPVHAASRRPRGSDRWRVRQPVAGVIEGYTTVASGPPGTAVGLRVSTIRPHFRVLAFRIGAYRGGTGRLVWRSGSVRGREQPGPTFAPYATRTVVAPWRTSLTLPTAGWRPGFYVLRLTTSGAAAQVPYVVTSPSTAGTVALMVPMATWQAYNRWGGYSLYEGPAGDRHAWAVSFDRPFEGVDGMNDFRTAVVPVVLEAEHTGVPLSYATDVELSTTAGVLSGARGYVQVGHSEYWTPQMRAAVLGARDQGTNLAFLGANTAYWRIRLSARGGRPARLETGYRDAALLDPAQRTRPALTTARFRDPPAAQPESALVGMLYECFPVDADYRIVSPEWWGFAGTGVDAGGVVSGLVGGEADRVYPSRWTPRPLQILSNTSYSCRGVRTTSQAVYYTVPSGAGVFAAGTLRWGCALADHCDVPLRRATTRFVRVVTDNLLRAYAAGPVGRSHPAQDNLDRFHLPRANSVPAS
ncbi:N,N-dimethylformamidase beta subunit family domain-containing protein [Nocardioides sp. CER19]|uniref:N,N-dimethylformamidase beta subunit family domain-containing protein n=1 Tax=Nocardioides sp. CER19 TaxID=3038538 RepID=UPI00244996EC|nr:N,N-dimethylformamidase beta subunit family domain-containing protein [Nocardioides sp. CER19]MDH2415940.1 hypothetical protein [Nocardioides sp. CER19]